LNKLNLLHFYYLAKPVGVMVEIEQVFINVLALQTIQECNG